MTLHRAKALLAILVCAVPLAVACGGSGSTAATGLGGRAGDSGGAGAGGGLALVGGGGGAGTAAHGSGGSPSPDAAGSGGNPVAGAGGAVVHPTPLNYRGVSLAGAEFGDQNLPGIYDKDYTYPTPGEVDYFMGKGMNLLRLPFRWERLQPVRKAAFDSAELARIDAFVTYATGKGATVVLDLHNYARYRTGTVEEVVGVAVPNADFAQFWGELAAHFKGNPLVVFGIMNEPYDMENSVWLGAANAALKSIRDAGATNLAFVSGADWDGAHSWVSGQNHTVMLGVIDPGNNYVFEVHQYLDSDSSGTSDVCVSPTIGVERLKDFTAWCEQNGKRAFLGEFSGGDNVTCTTALDLMLRDMEAHPTVWLGWAYWAAGPWWDNSPGILEPQGAQDAPMMSILAPHLR